MDDMLDDKTGVSKAPKLNLNGNLPVMIIHILNSFGNGLLLFGVRFGTVEFVGIVRKIDYYTSKITYQLEDHSGRVDATLWLDEDTLNNIPDVSLNKYARVLGTVFERSGGMKDVIITKIIAIKSPNEVTTHFLEVLNARAMLKKFLGLNAEDSEAANSPEEQPSTSGGSFAETMGLAGSYLAIFNAIKRFTSGEGISRNELRHKFPDIGELNYILDYLMQRGFIYSTIDVDHFQNVE